MAADPTPALFDAAREKPPADRAAALAAIADPAVRRRVEVLRAAHDRAARPPNTRPTPPGRSGGSAATSSPG